MKRSNRVAVCLTAVSLLLVLAFLTSNVSGQDGAWLFVRADYGFRNQRADVTGLVRDLILHGGVHGQISVSNQTMGGDPFPGADKVLRIFARDARNEDREFDYVEGAFVPAGLFMVERPGDRDDQAGRDDHDNHGRGDDRDRGDWNRLTIVNGFYGVQGRMVSVTDRLQSMVHNGQLSVVANNASMGGDPAPGGNKLLIVVYQYHGQQQAMAASEGHLLALP